MPPLPSLLSFLLHRHPLLAAEVSPQGDLALLLPLKAFLGAQRCLLQAWEQASEGEISTAACEGGGTERMRVEGAEGVQGADVDVDERLCVLLEHGMAREGTWELHASTAAALLKMAAASFKVSRQV